MSLNFALKLIKAKDDMYSLSTTINQLSGELLQNDMYLTFTGNEKLEARANYHVTDQRLRLKQLKIIVPEVASAQISGQIALSQKTPQYNCLHDFPIFSPPGGDRDGPGGGERIRRCF